MDAYIKRLKCIVEQYDNFIEPEIGMHLNGTVTRTEDTADNGGIKLAYRAYEKSLSLNQQPQARLIALDFTPKQLFWISLNFTVKFNERSQKDNNLSGMQFIRLIDFGWMARL